MNNRTHRKLLVVDGDVGFTGGAGIADRWQGDARTEGQWRDDFFRLRGPVVADMQNAFFDNWREVSGEVVAGDAWFPVIPRTGDATAQVFAASPGGASGGMQLLYLAAIAGARESILLAMPYFIPDEVAVAMLSDASRRGVKVTIMLPGASIDYGFVRRASRAKWGPLLEAGAEIHEYGPTMFHRKSIVVDRRWVSFGSSNFDSRSFSVNDEANVNVFDEAFALRMASVFDDDLRRSRRVTLVEWMNRSWLDRTLDGLAALLAPQL